MKVIFLDIDGVLNSHRYDMERTTAQGNIDESRLPLLKRIVEATGAVIVLTTSWRKHWHSDERKCDEIGLRINQVFQKYGLKIFSKTPLISPNERAAEIQTWLENCDQPVEAFVILDDIFAGWGQLNEHLVKTNARIGRGLEEKHIQAAIALLQGSGAATTAGRQ